MVEAKYSAALDEIEEKDKVILELYDMIKVFILFKLFNLTYKMFLKKD